MFNLAIVLIAISAVIGLTMAVRHFRGQTPPAPVLAVLHGVLVGSGVVVLLFGVLDLGFGTVHTWALVLFGIVALGGIYLVSHHVRGRPLPGAVVAMHGIGAAIAFLLLLLAVYLGP